MVRKAARPEPTARKPLQPLRQHCPHCGRRLGADSDNHRTVTARDGRGRLTLQIRRCRPPAGSAYLRPYRPEAEGRYALPQQEFGRAVSARGGALR